MRTHLGPYARMPSNKKTLANFFHYKLANFFHYKTAVGGFQTFINMV